MVDPERRVILAMHRNTVVQKVAHFAVAIFTLQTDANAD